MDIEPSEEKINITEKLETIDYSHGASAALSAAWGEGGMPSTVQSVDYNHGQGAMQGMGQEEFRGYPPTQATFGEFPSYSNYEGFPLHANMPFPQAGPQTGAFFSGIDAASLFAAYSEQAGQ